MIYNQRARWFKLGNRFELVYIMKYDTSYEEHNNLVAIRRMNHKPWTESLPLDSGFRSLMEAQEAVNYPISFTAADIECFLYCAMETFCKYYEEQVM